MSEAAALIMLSCVPEGAQKGGAQTRRVLEMLNTPIALLAAVVAIVALNGFLLFSYYLPRTTTPPASPSQAERTTTLERTTVERTQPTETRPRTSEETTTSGATATATASP
jgi:hypothetical protein